MSITKHALTAVAFLIGFCGLLAAQPDGGLSLEYEIAANPGSDRIPIRLHIQGIQTPALLLRLTDNYAGVSDYADAILDLKTSVPIDYRDGLSIRLALNGATRATVSYAISLSGSGNPSDRGRTLPVLDQSHLFFPGASTLVYPAVEDQFRHDSGTGRVRVRLKAPDSWAVASSWGANQREFEFAGRDINDLIYSFIVAGDYRVLETDFEGLPVHAAIRGQGATDDSDLLKFVVRMLAGHRETFGIVPFRQLLLVGDYAYTGGTTSGNASHNTVNLAMPRDRNLADYLPLKDLIAHETFHLWNGGDGAIAYSEQDVLWVSEGITEYYALRNMVRSGLLREEEMLDDLGSKLQQLNSSYMREQPLVEAGRRFFEDTRSRNLVYTKGALAGFLLDISLQRMSRQEQSLDDVLRRLGSLRDNMTRGERYGQSDVLAAIEHIGGTSLRRIHDGFASGDYRTTLDRVLVECGYEILRVGVEGFTLGIFDGGHSSLEPALRSLDRDGPAYRAGLREGDRVLEVGAVVTKTRRDLTSALSETSKGSGKPVRITAEREGMRLHFTVTPERFHRILIRRTR